MNSTGWRFSSCNRLKKPEQFKQVFSSKIRSGDKSFLFVARKNGINIARLGLAVPKKNIHQSVKRNLIKRRIRESFRLKKDQFAGLDIVVVVKQHLKIDSADLEKILNKHWNNVSK